MATRIEFEEAVSKSVGKPVDKIRRTHMGEKTRSEVAGTIFPGIEIISHQKIEAGLDKALR